MTIPTTNPNDDDPTQRQQTPEARRTAFYADALASWGVLIDAHFDKNNKNQ